MLLMYPLQAGLSVALVAHALGAGPHRVLSHAVLVWLGQRSYGIYVYHGMLRIALAAFAARLVHVQPTASVLVAFTVGITVTLGLSELSFRFFESPINALRRHFGHAS
jgi:peptidoglycan/LPS O-acetylase OafA/YrhL